MVNYVYNFIIIIALTRWFFNKHHGGHKALQALQAHSCYRSSVSVWWLNAMNSPTPGVPMSRRRVEDLMQFCYGLGQPRFHSDRMIEVAVTYSELDCEIPSNLQVISPEEVLHATLAGCALAVKFLVLIIVFFSV